MLLKHFMAAPLTNNGFQVANSSLIEDGSAQYFSRTLTTPTDSNVWTLSAWVKRTELDTAQYIFSSTNAHIGFNASNQIDIVGGATTFRVTSGLYRDTSDFMHIVVEYNSDEVTAGDRVKLWIDGVQETNFGTTNNPTSAADMGTMNTAVAHAIGIDASDNTTDRLNAYVSECVFIDGQALDASNFGEFNINGRWRPINISGLTFGNNGFYLKFSNGADLGEDQSGNNNDWTNNGTVAQSDDSPTKNFLILNDNEANSSLTLSAGNTVMTGGASHQKAIGTIGLPTSGKYYVEAVVTTTTSASVAASIGICDIGRPANLTATTQFTDGIMMYASNAGNVDEDATNLFTGFTFTGGDVLQLAIDLDNNKMWFGINDSYFDSTGGTTGNPATGANPVSTTDWKGYVIAFGLFSNTLTIQADTNSFSHTPPSGFSALQASNLPAPTVIPSEHFNTILYTGTSASQSVTGVGFQPDMVWSKCRNDIEEHDLFDSVRGATKLVNADGTGAEVTDAQTLTSFDSDGFTVGTSARVNNAATGSYVSWCWKADNTSGASNTDGSITSTVAANITAGFSIVTYTGTGANATVGHGLGATPDAIFIKSRSAGATQWVCYHGHVGPTKAMQLDASTGPTTSAIFWNNTAPNTTVFSLGTTTDANTNSQTHVAYCFAEVDNISKFGQYVGNSSTDGPYVHTGFKPAFVLIKCSSTTGSWVMLDSQRDPFNEADATILADTTAAETAANDIDLLNNGFKVRSTSGNVNTSGATYVYMAFAEYPFSRQ